MRIRSPRVGEATLRVVVVHRTYLGGQARLDLIVERGPIVRCDVQEDTLVARTHEAVNTRGFDVIRAASPRAAVGIGRDHGTILTDNRSTMLVVFVTRLE